MSDVTLRGGSELQSLPTLDSARLRDRVQPVRTVSCTLHSSPTHPAFIHLTSRDQPDRGGSFVPHPTVAYWDRLQTGAI